MHPVFWFLKVIPVSKDLPLCLGMFLHSEQDVPEIINLHSDHDILVWQVARIIQKSNQFCLTLMSSG